MYSVSSFIINALIEIRNLSFAYPDAEPILRNVNLTFREGESVALMGANGAGKTTLLRCINGLLKPTDGDVVVDGLSVSDPDQLFEIRRNAGMVFQNPDDQIVSSLVEREIAFGLENLGIPTSEIHQRIDSILPQFELTEYRRRDPNTLSGGERQRLALASVIAMRPRYLLLDEPTSLLDPGSRSSLLALLKTLRQSGIVTTISVTQIPAEALQADRIVILDHGNAVMDGPPSEIFTETQRLEDFGLTAPLEAQIALSLGFSNPLPLMMDSLIKALPDPPQQASSPPINRTQESPRPAVISSQELTHIYNPDLPTRVVALEKLTVEIPEKSITALIGPSGSGKSTFAQHLNGLLLATTGGLRVCDFNLPGTSDLKALRRQVGLIFQFPEAQLFAETVFDDIAFGPRNLGYTNLQDRVHQALLDVALQPESFCDRNPLNLSTGEKRRVAIAGVIAMQPGVLILDEPTAGLDPAGALAIETLLRNWRDHGRTVILITHDMDLAAKLSDHIIAFDAGHHSFSNSPEAVFRKSSNLDTLGLALPQTVQIANALRNLGWKIPPGTLTSDGLIQSMKALID